MNIIACIDNNNGLIFNGRRQSRDIAVINRIYDLVSGQTLLINSFSEKLFPFLTKVSEDFLEIATENDFCFVENVSVSKYLEKIDRVILFRWNRNYPYDFTLDLDLQKKFSLVQSDEMEGNSHERITMEVWQNEKNKV